MYLARFLGAPLDTYRDTSGYVYMYLELFIKIHHDTPRYKIMIHVSYSGWMRDTIWIAYLECIQRGTHL